jgi:hypothetical protein
MIPQPFTAKGNRSYLEFWTIPVVLDSDMFLLEQHVILFAHINLLVVHTKASNNLL